MNKTDSASGEKIRVLIVDDHAMVRQGLRTFLELQNRSTLLIEVTGEASNGLEAVKMFGYNVAQSGVVPNHAQA